MDFMVSMMRIRELRAGHYLGLHRQLGSGFAQGFMRHDGFYTIYLEHYAAGLNHGYEADRLTLTLSHFHFGRLLGERMVWENADPDFTGLSSIVHGGLASGLDLVGSNTGILHSLEAERTERDFETTSLCLPSFFDSVLALGEPLAMFYFLWE
jgi:hypothetical protein